MRAVFGHIELSARPAHTPVARAEYESGHIYLVRPDAYVMISGKDGDAAPILEALGRVAAKNAAAS